MCCEEFAVRLFSLLIESIHSEKRRSGNWLFFNIRSVVHKFWLISRRFRKSVFRDSVFHFWQVQKSACTQIWSTLANTSCLSHPPNCSLTWQDAAAISRSVTPVSSITDFWIWLLQTEKTLTELHGPSASTFNMARRLRQSKTFSSASFWYEVVRPNFHNLRLRLLASHFRHTIIQSVAQSVTQMTRVTVCVRLTGDICFKCACKET
jgi:hypothetical protein